MKGATVILVGSAWLLTVAGSFYTGLRMSAESVTDTGSSKKSATTTLELRPAQITKGTQSSKFDSQIASPAPAADVGTDTETPVDTGFPYLSASLDAILAEDDFLARSSKLAAFLARLTPDSLEEAKAYFAELAKDGWANNREIEMFLHAWSKFDPSAAMNFARDNIQGRGAIFIASSVLRDWSSRDKGAAIDWILSQEDGRLRQMSLAVLLNSEASRDPSSAIQTLQFIPEDQTNARLVGMVAERIASADPAAALNWAATLSDANLRDSAMRSIAEGWSGKDPVAAAAWLQTNMEASFAPGAAAEIARAMTANDPKAAATWVSSLSQGPVAASAAASMIEAWAQSDPTAAGEWLNALSPGETTDAAVERYARVIAQTNPAASVEWATSITNEATRQQTFIELAGYWQSRYPQEAATYLNKLGLDDKTKDDIQRASEVRRPPWARRPRP